MSEQDYVRFGELKIFMHQIYEFKKGVRNLVLCTMCPTCAALVAERLRGQRIEYLIQEVTDKKVTTPDIIVRNRVDGKVKGFAYESIRSFVDRLIDGKPFLVSTEDAANTSLALLAVLESAEKREPVTVKY